MGFCITFVSEIMKPILKIAAVSYLNTFPFVYGIRASGYLNNYLLDLEVPAQCAERLKHDEADIALVPVGALPEIGDYHIVSPYCIGAVKDVRSVLLLSHHPLDRIRKIYLDVDSRTSVKLVKVLARHYWKINPQYEPLKMGSSFDFSHHEAVVAIGDKTFEMHDSYPFVYDLAGEWIKFTTLPFVFAIWVSKRRLPENLTEPFCQALSYGISHKQESLAYFHDKLPWCGDCLNYLEENISYDFDKIKEQGLYEFLNFLDE